MVASKPARLEEFFRRLLAGPAAASEAEALRLISDTLNEVEDEMTDVLYDPTKWQTDGRLYPPMPDSRRHVPGYEQVARYRSRGHNTYIGTNGSIEIVTLDGSVLLEKPGSDGRSVWSL